MSFYIIIATWLKLPLLYGERTHLCGHYIYFYGLSTFRGLDNGISPYLSCVFFPDSERTWFSEERGEGTITPGSNGASGTVRPV